MINLLFYFMKYIKYTVLGVLKSLWVWLGALLFVFCSSGVSLECLKSLAESVPLGTFYVVFPQAWAEGVLPRKAGAAITSASWDNWEYKFSACSYSHAACTNWETMWLPPRSFKMLERHFPSSASVEIHTGRFPATEVFVCSPLLCRGCSPLEDSPPYSGLLLKFPHSAGPRHCLGLLHPSQPSTWTLQSTSFNHLSNPGLTLWIWAFASFLTFDGYLLSCHLISIFTIL